MRIRLEDLNPRLRAQAEAQLDGQKPRPRAPLSFRRTPSLSLVSDDPADTDDARTASSSASPAPRSAVLTDGKKKKRKPRPIMAVRSIETVLEGTGTDYDCPERVRLTFYIDPSLIPTAQQKGIDFKHGLVYTQSFVRHTENLFMSALSRHVGAASHLAGRTLRVAASFFFPYPKSTPKHELVDMRLAPCRGDVDNIWKGLGDSFTRSGFWTDDQFIADLRLRKYRTLGRPRIVVEVEPEVFREDIPLFGGILDGETPIGEPDDGGHGA